jgi:hypothetical protein
MPTSSRRCDECKRANVGIDPYNILIKSHRRGHSRMTRFYTYIYICFVKQNYIFYYLLFVIYYFVKKRTMTYNCHSPFWCVYGISSIVLTYRIIPLQK